jgi:hypothetical protein
MHLPKYYAVLGKGEYFTINGKRKTAFSISFLLTQDSDRFLGLNTVSIARSTISIASEG